MSVIQVKAVMLSQKYYLGVDGGASKTSAILIDDTNKIVGQGTSGGTNLHNISKETVEKNLISSINIALGDLSLNQATSACFGFAGIENEITRNEIVNIVKQKFGNSIQKNIILVKDEFIGLRAGTLSDNAIILISGTGSNCFGINNTDNEAAAGNQGYLVGDLGSGFSLGQALIMESVKEYDQRSETTALTRAILEQYQQTDLGQFIETVYQSKDPIKYIAQATKILHNHHIYTLPKVELIINQTIIEILLALSTVVTKLGFSNDSQFDVVLVGGVFNLEKVITLPLINQIRRHYPQANINRPQHESAYGACQIAKSYSLDTTYRLPNLHFVINN